MDNQRKQQARQIFMEIIDLPDGPQHSKLDELCGDNTPLKLDIEALLLAHQQAKDFMANPTASGHSAPITEKPGTVIGPYKLLQQIGEGGFGTVFLAEQSKPIRRRVALKIIKLGMDTKQVIARFEAERQALALMDHPNIARVLDAGATETGRPYFVMEYVVGDSVTEFADAHKLSLRQRLALFNQVCAAVQHAHTKGIIHRDIKPSNILVSMTDGKPLAKVIDFGIAKATATPLTEKTLFTEHHQLIGTLQYMSPEQAEGLPDIDTRTDVYALGVLLYELLTGQTPIDGKRLRSAAWNEIRRIIKEEEPPAPSMSLSRNVNKLAEVASARQADPSKLSAILKGELDWITIKALDKDRARRYETPSALAADVQRHLDGDAVIAAPVSRGYKMRKFVQRNRGMVVTGSTVAVALLLGLAGMAWGLRSASNANDKLQWRIDVANDYLALMMGEVWDNATPVPLESIELRLNDRTLATIQYEPGVNDYGDRVIRPTIVSTRRVDRETALQKQTVDGYGLIQLGEWGLAAFRNQRDALDELKHQTNAAEWSAYTANLALAQMAMDNGNWPEARERIAACPKSKRGWEWKFLSNKAESVIAEFRGWATLSPDGTRIFVSTGSNARVYDLEGNPIGKRISNEYNTSGSFSLDSSRILVWFFDDRLFRGFQVLDNDASPIGSVIRTQAKRPLLTAISFDGSMVVEASANAARLWSASGDLIADIPTHPTPIDSVGFSPDGKMAYTISEDNKVRLWALDGTPVGLAMSHDAIIRSVNFSSDMTLLLTASDDQTAQRWTLDGLPIGERMQHEDGVSTSALDPNQDYIITQTESVISVWNWDGILLSRTPRDGRSRNSPISWSKKYFLRCQGDFAIATAFDGQDVGIAMKFPVSARTPEFSILTVLESDGVNMRVTWAPRADRVYVWDDLGMLQSTISITEPYLEHVVILPNASGILTEAFIAGTNKYFSKYQVRPLSSSVEVRIHSSAMTFFQIESELHPDGVHQLNTSESQTVAFAPDATFSAAHPDGSRIVTAASDNTVRFWDPETKKELAAIPMDAGVTNITFTPDGTRLVIELDDGSARIFDTRSPEEQAADVQRHWAERIPAGEYLDTLMARPIPTDDLMSVIETAPSLTPLRRLAAAELLLERLSDIKARSSREFEALSKDQTDKATVLAAAQAADLPPRVKERVLAEAEEWEYTPPRD